MSFPPDARPGRHRPGQTKRIHRRNTGHESLWDDLRAQAAPLERAMSAPHERVDSETAQPGHAGAADAAAARTRLRRRGGAATLRYAGPGTATTIPRSLDPPPRVPSRRPAPGAARPNDRAWHADARHVAPHECGRLRRAPHHPATDADAITCAAGHTRRRTCCGGGASRRAGSPRRAPAHLRRAARRLWARHSRVSTTAPWGSRCA